MEAIAWDVARGLARRGAEVAYVTTSIPGYESEFEEDGVTVIALSGTKPGRYSRAWWKGSREIFRQRFGNSLRAVLSVSAGAYSVVRSRNIARDTKFVLQVHGTSLSEAVSKLRTGKLMNLVRAGYNLLWLGRDLATYPLFDEVIAVGDRVYESFLSPPVSLVVPAERIQLIANGVDEEMFYPSENARHQARQRLGLQANCTVVVTVSRLQRQKGVDLALKGFARWSQGGSHSRYLVVGSGPEGKRLRELARSLGLENRVRFTGSVSREEVPDYLRAADIFLFTTLHREGLPLNVLEAAGVGLPLAVPYALTEVVEALPMVFPLNPKNPESIAHALGRATALVEGGMGRDRRPLPDKYTLRHTVDEYARVLC
jgi:glycosyltransferase involved in cell wall biosynthesis